MEQEKIKTDEKNSKKPKVMLYLFIIPILLLILLTGITVVGIYFIKQDGRSQTSQVIGLTSLILIIAVISLSIGVWRIYFSARYIQIPVWRWIASGFKGEPKLLFSRFPWATKSAMAKAKSKMNKKQRLCMWIGNVCSALGTFFLLIAVSWRLVLAITGERTIDSSANILFWVGIFIFFAGVCIVKASIPKDTQNMAPPENR